MFKRSDAALVALRQILKAVDANARGIARSSGLTPSQLISLRLLDHIGEANPSVLAKRMSLTMATVTALVDKLEDQGFIARRRDETDRRRMLVGITRAGKKAISQSPDVLQARFQDRFDALAAWEQAAVIAALERVVALLGAADIDASPVLDIGALNDPPEKQAAARKPPRRGRKLSPG